MTLNNLDIVKKYLPYIYYDKNEPFYPREVGYTLFYETSKSPSFNRLISVEGDTHYVIEYAIYWDFDIGHLYDLEHIWIYVDKKGRIKDAEGSFHGKYLKALLKDGSNIEDHTHLRLYSQPGKHAFMSKDEYFYLIPDLTTATYEKAGNDGLIVPDIFVGQYSTNETINEQVLEYLQLFRFRPSLEFEKRTIQSSLLVPWEELWNNIPIYVNDMIKEIENLGE